MKRKEGRMKRMAVVLGMVGLMIAMPVLVGHAAAQGKENWPKSVSFGGAFAGTGFTIVATSVCDLLRKHNIGVKATAQITPGGRTNMVLMRKGEMELAFVSADDGYYAYRGEEVYSGQGEGKVPLRVIAIGHAMGQMSIVRAESPIKGIGDIRGKRVMWRSEGSRTAYRASKAIMEAYDIDPDKDVITLPLESGKELSSAMTERKADAGIYTLALPRTSSVHELCTTIDIRFLPLDNEHITKIRGKYPFYYPEVIPAGTYKLQEKEVPIPGWTAMIVCRADLPESLIYEITKTIYDNLDEFHKFHPICATYYHLNRAVMLEQMVAPFHSGAIKYYKEKGIWTKGHSELQDKFLKLN